MYLGWACLSALVFVLASEDPPPISSVGEGGVSEAATSSSRTAYRTTISQPSSTISRPGSKISQPGSRMSPISSGPSRRTEYQNISAVNISAWSRISGRLWMYLSAQWSGSCGPELHVLYISYNTFEHSGLAVVARDLASLGRHYCNFHNLLCVYTIY